MHGMYVNRPQPMYLSAMVQPGQDPDVPPPDPMDPVWETTYITGTTATTYVFGGVDPVNEDNEFGYISCDLTGMLEGDLVVIFCPWVSQSGAYPDYLPVFAGGTYFSWGGYYYALVAAKRLTAADLITPPKVYVQSGLSIYSCVRTECYRGPIDGAVRDTSTGAATSLIMSGFSKAANHRGLMTLVTDRNTTTLPTTPGGLNVHGTVNLRSAFAYEIADILNDTYAGADMTWTTLSSLYSQLGALVEFLG